MKSGHAKVGYGISFFGVLSIKIKHLRLLTMVGIVFLPEVEAYTRCQRKVNDYYVNIEIVLNNLKERTQSFALYCICYSGMYSF